MYDNRSPEWVAFLERKRKEIEARRHPLDGTPAIGESVVGYEDTVLPTPDKEPDFFTG